ncbi:MAG: hypothetical protein HZC55_04230 [Verrucomicrobia bacterium]|nr:hypothetical protein [Verrucomicrobiota bacterium]
MSAVISLSALDAALGRITWDLREAERALRAYRESPAGSDGALLCLGGARTALRDAAASLAAADALAARLRGAPVLRLRRVKGEAQ